MDKNKEFKQEKAGAMLREAGIKITDEEEKRIVVSDFDLGDTDRQGAQILEFLNTKRVGVRMIVLFPYQTLPEHYHRAVPDDPGKEETVRVASGTLYLYVPGEENIKDGFIPKGEENNYTVRHEIVLKECGQYTLEPGTPHWFQASADGAVLYTFTSYARDKHNIFTNPGVINGCVNDLD
jgi:D-lyxose ketol-isomerase